MQEHIKELYMKISWISMTKSSVMMIMKSNKTRNSGKKIINNSILLGNQVDFDKNHMISMI